MKPLAEHLADYGAYLAAEGNTAEHVEKSCAASGAWSTAAG